MGNKESGAPAVSIALKAGLWYTVCNFLLRAMSFISTPIFARLMTKPELGQYANFSSWISVMTVITSMDLRSSVIRSKLEFEKDMDSYIYSALSLATIITLIFYMVVFAFQKFFVKFFGLDMKYINFMFLYLFAAPAYQMLITKHRAFFKYKSFVAVTGITIISSTILALLLVLFMENRFAGRVFGFYFPYIVIGLITYVLLIKRGKKIKIKYWKYACVICVPLVPHMLSFYLLDTSDKILITKISGSEYTAIYTIAYSCFHIVTILLDSMNKAWAPWFLENLHWKNYDEIKSVSKKYTLVFLMLLIFILMVVPELIFILGGEKYMSAKYCLPPLIAGCFFQFVYTFYVNIEFYMKKTVGVAVATTIAALLNIVLNLVFIPMNPKYGYVIAAYTTLVGYIVLFLLHYLYVKRLRMEFVIDIKFVVFSMTLTIIITGIMNFFYNLYFIRYCIVLCYLIFLSVILWRNKDQIMSVIRGK